ncbi:hypothetical protein KSD_41520 [Ktedonobacter sp. SOSP1-85]|nr:hypothetical protein KSD_41520 [Ktedonobacter sp. SOSP1-85]
MVKRYSLNERADNHNNVIFVMYRMMSEIRKDHAINNFLSYDILQIPTTLGVINDCWRLAEAEMQQEIKKYYPDKQEEFITELFHGRFAFALEKASNDQLIAIAFLKDLMVAYPDILETALEQIANGLVADVTLHKRSTERKTGGDLGLMIVRPQIIRDQKYLIKHGDYRRGILCQAKMKSKDKKWGQFTRQQKKQLPSRMSYLCLLLYSYKDLERRELNNYQWYVCKNDETLDQVAEYLKRDEFPRLLSSESIIAKIGFGMIGTDDDAILDEIVAPKKNTALIIRLFWPNGPWSGPDGGIYIGTSIRIYTAQENDEQYYRQQNEMQY